MTTATVSPVSVGLTQSEYAEIVRRLGRDPSPLELQLFGVMWSEHCGYKHSRLTLQLLPSEGPRLLQGPGENAGVMDIGGGWGVAFKMESHNHPSAVDPYNGAATGVGGIIRDVLSMGARPIALLDSLRFGSLDDPRARAQANGVVRGIAGYGNCIGVPTVGGELLTDSGYRGNPLVNVACLGLVRRDHLARSRAGGPGSAVVYAGARTGRDGIGGAAFASEELNAQRDDRAAVQLGDPFAGKLLIEATLEALATGQVTAVQDMGAAGLTCAASEMAARGGVGMVIDLDAVPLREASMRPEEILRSESQERMLLVVRPGSERAVVEIFHRWGLQAAGIGSVIEEPELRIFHRGTVVVSLPPYALAEAPAYRPAACEPIGLAARWALDESALSTVDAQNALLRLLAHPDVASKRAVFQQYDYSVQVRTVVGPGAADAAVLRVIESPPKGVALAVDGNGRVCALDPYRGARLAVAEVTAGLACVGAVPLGITDCLNFGNPEDPEVFWTFRQAVAGIADACRALRVPVVGGNVSFYNESPEGPIPPTPVVAAVGLIDDVTVACGAAFQESGSAVVLLGRSEPRLAGSLFLKQMHGLACGRPEDVDFDLHGRTLTVLREAIARGWLQSAHDCSDGGLAVALAECAIGRGIGADFTLPDSGRADAALFGEAPSRIVVSLAESHLADFRDLAAAREVPFVLLGRTGGDALRITVADVRVIDAPISELAQAHDALAEIFQ
ncbi:MAG TPA: phosphoribosylformylglycinamidine synthase subunit PurL [bacterium]|jgi:phosphoribosylformylglycinamidine synthase